MESGPAVFSGVAFALFGGGLLLWTAVRVRTGAPVASGVSHPRAAVLAALFGTLFMTAGVWLLLTV